jgi:hypothetical protein
MSSYERIVNLLRQIENCGDIKRVEGELEAMSGEPVYLKCLQMILKDSNHSGNKPEI